MFIADYAPGQDAIDSFGHGFAKGGGKMLDPIRVPMNTTDFSSYFQKVHDNNPQCLVDFMPGGPMSAGTIKGFADRGFAKQGMVLAGSVGTPIRLPGDRRRSARRDRLDNLCARTSTIPRTRPSSS